MKKITVHAPCKINLSLDIVRRLENGYHEMDMVMQSVDLCDTLTLSLSDGNGTVHMTCDCESYLPPLACDESNIAVKCANSFFAHSGCSLARQALSIHLAKRIPLMAGLGGGSADGAAVLYGLNRLFQNPCSPEQLEQIGVRCGADIPFCLKGGTLRAKGIGEQFSPLPPMPDCFLVLIKPRFGVSTSKAFARCDSFDYPHADPQKTADALSRGSLVEIAASLSNVFESVCSEQEHELILKAHRLLRQNGALGSLLSGSGSALFGIFSREEQANSCLKQLSSHPLLEAAFLCRPISHGVFCSEG